MTYLSCALWRSEWQEEEKKLSVFVQCHTYLRPFTEALQLQLGVSEQTQLAWTKYKKVSLWKHVLTEVSKLHGETAFLQISQICCVRLMTNVHLHILFNPLTMYLHFVMELLTTQTVSISFYARFYYAHCVITKITWWRMCSINSCIKIDFCWQIAGPQIWDLNFQPFTHCQPG